MVRIPTRGNPHMCNAAWVAWAQKQRPLWDIKYHPNTMCVALARNEIVREARQAGVDRLIMIDDDVVPPTALFKMPGRDVDIVSGIVPTWRDDRLIWSVYRYEAGVRHAVEYFIGEHLNEVDAVGGACLCLGKKILNDKNLPALFGFNLNRDGTLAPGGGEDIAFCMRARAAGYKILVDPDVVCEHLQRIDMGATKAHYDNAHTDTDNRRTPLHRPDAEQPATHGTPGASNGRGRPVDIGIPRVFK